MERRGFTPPPLYSLASARRANLGQGQVEDVKSSVKVGLEVYILDLPPPPTRLPVITRIFTCLITNPRKPGFLRPANVSVKMDILHLSQIESLLIFFPLDKQTPTEIHHLKPRQKSVS